MTAHRLARPASTWAGYQPWLADEGSWPEAKAVALEHRYRARDFLLRQIESLEQELFCRTADLCTADVDLSCWDTTTRSCESDEEADASAPWHDRTIPARRPRGHHQEGRAGHPQVGVGLALPRDGWPVRSWGGPGHTAEVTTSNHRTADWQGGRVNRGGVVGDRGMGSEAKRQRLRRALGRDILAVPRRQGTAVPLNVLTRAGRDRAVAHNLRGQEVDVGEGERRRRDLVGHTPDEAAREKPPRERLVAWVRAELAPLDPRPAAPPKNAGELLAARRCGRYLRRDAHGRLSLEAAQVAAAATDAGKFVVTPNDDPLDAEDVALGDPSMPRLEGSFRQMKTTGLQTRPIDHWRPPRLIAPVQRCVLAWLLERAAEIRGQHPWRTIRPPLDQLQVVRYRRQGQTMVQRTQVTSPMAEILPRLGSPWPKKLLEGFE